MAAKARTPSATNIGLLRNYRITYASLRGGSGGFVMKFASFENLLMAATLVMFVVFITWSVKLITAWT
jgi:preprotein translocase subunit SecG